jgi:2-desacetyl-2-hydroxyethyl bacteriochlorophyllide A dehydrogenase
MKSRALFFTGPRAIEIRSMDLPAPVEDQVLVATELSAISAGTELLVYRGELAEGTVLDETLPSLGAEFRYPLRYGYASVGRVVARGPKAPHELEGRSAFGFEPHGSHFLARADSLHPLPETMPSEAACLLPTVETALSLVHDARPLAGERVLVVGQGVVGLVTTALLARFPLARLVTVDPFPARRRLSMKLGAGTSVTPEDLGETDFDLSVEVSGAPRALNVAIAATGNEGRVVVGSWYGEKRGEVDLGTHFHRGRLTLLSSQVSRIGSPLTARWSKKRRLRAALELLPTLPAEELVSHRFDLERAADAYRLLDEDPGTCLQVVLTCGASKR